MRRISGGVVIRTEQIIGVIRDDDDQRKKILIVSMDREGKFLGA